MKERRRRLFGIGSQALILDRAAPDVNRNGTPGLGVDDGAVPATL
ncbi:MAG: hypothetical protein WCT12_17950 [Verrucomicrobiota bacterium]